MHAKICPKGSKVLSFSRMELIMTVPYAQSPESTAIDVDHAVVAVRATSRLWLNFLHFVGARANSGMNSIEQDERCPESFSNKHSEYELLEEDQTPWTGVDGTDFAAGYHNSRIRVTAVASVIGKDDLMRGSGRIWLRIPPDQS